MTNTEKTGWAPTIVETNLNLRRNGFPRLEAYVAEQQIKLCPDIIANVEDRESCDRKGYDDMLKEAGYQRVSATDRDQRGVSCWVKSGLWVEKVFEMTDPHFMHVRVTSQEGAYIDLMLLRVLVRVSKRGAQDIKEVVKDFRERAEAWRKIEAYIDKLDDHSHIVLTGDFNHGVPCEDPACYAGKPRQHYNYQLVCQSMRERALTVAHIPGYSKEGSDGYESYSIDHLITGTSVGVEKAAYQDPFEGPQRARRQGVPDHAMIVATLKVWPGADRAEGAKCANGQSVR